MARRECVIPLANSPAGAAGPQAPEYSFLLLLLPASLAKAATKDRSLEGLALQTSQSAVSQQKDVFA
jgi:hypothetical protein